MGNSLSVNQLQGALVDRLKSVSFTTDEATGNLRVRSFSDGGHLTARAATNIMREEHRNSLDVIHRPRYVRTSCTTIPEEDVFMSTHCVKYVHIICCFVQQKGQCKRDFANCPIIMGISLSVNQLQSTLANWLKSFLSSNGEVAGQMRVVSLPDGRRLTVHAAPYIIMHQKYRHQHYVARYCGTIIEEDEVSA
uniref:Uncharacterized protein n=1 Tax=Glossina palpalis gambiensis TaxID=67801 RepID=A0A1B0BBU4_9MUSC